MFRGIVDAVGQIIEVLTSDNGLPDAGVHLKITAPGFLRDSTKLGDSIAIQGACMTVVELSGDTFSVDVSRESLNRTTGLDTFGAVNLEHALRMGDRSEEHTSELQSIMRSSYAVLCLKKNKKHQLIYNTAISVR